MSFYLAPLEGITNTIFRNAYHRHFEPMDKYFAPFVSTSPNKRLTEKEQEDLCPEKNSGLKLIPQILSNNASDFLGILPQISDMGYDEVNLNLGCPSRIVASKGKGSGFLAHVQQLERFLDTIYTGSKVEISIKTRLGKTDPEEFYHLSKLFSQYPMKELIIHPRVQKDIYCNEPRMHIFKETFPVHKVPVCYNGDIFNVESYGALKADIPDVENYMFGRGILYDPALIFKLKDLVPPDLKTYQAFHNEIFHGYQSKMILERHLLSKMKEFWAYMKRSFSNCDFFFDKLIRCQTLTHYQELTHEMFDQLILKK